MTGLIAHMALALALVSGSWFDQKPVVTVEQPAASAPPGGRRFQLSSDTPFCTVPFTRAGNLIVVKARVDSLEGNFILDTGAPGLVLNLTYFRDYPVTHTADIDQTGITGSSAGVERTEVKTFVLGRFNYSNIEADLANLGHIENSKNIRILGLIGLEFFKECGMIIDFDNGALHLQHLSKKNLVHANYMLSDTATYKEIPIDIMDNRIVAVAELGGKKLKMIVDCAAETNILNSRLPSRLLEYVSISRRVKLTGSGTRPADALYGNVSDLKIADESVGNLPVLITNLENTCFSYNGCIDGVLGFDFLSLHKIGFNFVKRKMYIWK